MIINTELCKIVEFKHEYLDDILEIEKESFDPKEQYSREVFEWFLTLSPLFYIALCNSEVAGYVLAILENKKCHIASIAVRLKWRNRGLGKKLLSHVLEECRVRGAKYAVLEVAANNTLAIRLYKSMGFRVKEVIPGYYYGRRDAYVMEKDL